MLKKLSVRFWYDYRLFYQSILWYFSSTFLFGRLFYVISQWYDMRHIDNFFDFFITSDYHFSLFWAIFWFLSVLFFHTKLLKRNFSKYLDGVILSFLFILIFGFVGSFLWGQVFWGATSFWIEIPYEYNGENNLVWELFPLPLLYSGLFFLVFSGLYIWSLYIKIRGIIWYVWLGLFSAITLWLEVFSWKQDVFKRLIDINLSQIGAIFLFTLSIYGLIKIIKIWKKWGKTILWEIHN